MPIDHYDMNRILSIFPVIAQLRNIIQASILELSWIKTEQNRPVTLKKLKAYHTLIQTQEARIKKVNLNSVAAQQAAVRKLHFD